MEKLSKEIEKTDNRNYGIDLLRIIAMFFVVVLHALGHGGVLRNVQIDSLQYKFVWLLEIVAYCAVDVFALISGYVSYTNNDKKTNYSNYINLWFQVVFYGILITGVLDAINPALIQTKGYITALFPVTNNAYWYFTAYTGLFIIMPIINKGIRNCSEKTLKKLFIIIFLAFTVWEVLSSKFILNNGYSFIWLALLYILGAIMKKAEIGKDAKSYLIVIGIILLYIITYLNKIFGFGISKAGTYISYVSPTILGVAILHVVGFSKMKFNNGFNKIIKFAAPSTFAIYLINDNNLVRENLIRNLFAGIANSSLLNIFMNVIGFSFMFVIATILVDKIRILIFKIFKVKEISNKIIELSNKLIENFANLL